MKKSVLKYHFLVAIGIFVTSTFGCGIRYTIKGKVVDMDTGQPIKGAVVSVKWEKENFKLPGMGRSFDVLEVADDLTGSDGIFHIPKYIFRDYHLVVYKKGYVCWVNEDIFPNFEKRHNGKIENGIIIELEPYRKEYSVEKHARFVFDLVLDNTEKKRDRGNYKGLLIRETGEECELIWKKMGGGK